MKALRKLLGISALVVLLSTICAAEINVTPPDNTGGSIEAHIYVTSSAPITNVNLYFVDVVAAGPGARWHPDSDRSGTIVVMVKMQDRPNRQEMWGCATLVYEITNSAGEYTSGANLFLTQSPY